MIERGGNQERKRMRERREKVRARERSMERERERVYRERECVQGGHGFESETRGSQTRESRRIDATNARFETRVQVITRENVDADVGSASR